MNAGAAVPRRSRRIEELVRTRSSEFRRRLAIGFAIAVVVLAAVATFVAWRLYDDAKARALTDLRARTVSIGAIFDQAFIGDIATLGTAAQAPAVVHGQSGPVKAYLVRAFPRTGTFTAGVGWVGADGKLNVSNVPASPPGLDLSSRAYVSRVLATGKPYISGGLIGKRHHQEIVVIAVPTFDGRHKLSGVLAGSILVKPKPESRTAINLGFGDLGVVDRNGRMLMTGLGRVENRPLLVRMRREKAGVVNGTDGLDGSGDHVVSFFTVDPARWLVVIDRPASSVFSAARRALYLQLGSIIATLLVLFALGLMLLRRSGRQGAEQDARLSSWTRLTRRLASVSTPAEVSEVLLTTLADAFPDGLAIVAISGGDRLRSTARSRTARLGGVAGALPVLDAVSRVAVRGPRTWEVASEPALVPLRGAYARLDGVHGLPMRHGTVLYGALALATPASSLDANDWALLESFAELGAQALERAWRFAHEHDLAVRLQRSLLPGGLPEVEGVDLDAHYLAGAAAVEVGGDWYDAVRRPDGILELCVGDVSGRGIGAATVMGTQRSTFRAYAYECVSPGAIVERMLRHVEGDGEMITVAAVSIDPFTAELVYTRAGHPPPLLLDLDTGETRRLDGAGAPPLGVAEAGDVVEEHVRLPDRALIALYTDGLVERRGLNMDDAIEAFASVLAEAPDGGAPDLVSRVGERLGAPDDDVALLVVTFDAARTGFDVELPAEPSVLSGMRRRLRGWLHRRGYDDEEASEILLAVSEACNNAVEHAYEGGHGTVRVRAQAVGDWLEVVVEDRGRWRDAEPGDDRGRGIMLIRRLMDSTEYESDHRGTRAVLRRRLPGQRPASGDRMAAELA
jgi:serine phosphatase RsbU (regulator of sigma subunit)/anti-sigma regulatory factor (Ser/Thr protein kinase)